jgi:hypothetical protein
MITHMRQLGKSGRILLQETYREPKEDGDLTSV